MYLLGARTIKGLDLATETPKTTSTNRSACMIPWGLLGREVITRPCSTLSHVKGFVRLQVSDYGMQLTAYEADSIQPTQDIGVMAACIICKKGGWFCPVSTQVVTGNHAWCLCSETCKN
jgi:hypothetical protein